MSTVTVALAVVGWTAGLVLLWRVRTPERHDVASGSLPSVTVVVPARNEADNLPRLLGSLAVQTAPAMQILVVDDDSSDDTAALAAAGGAQVIATVGPPLGWTGKTWACHLGAIEASGDLLVFLDADTWLAADGLERLAAEHARSVPDGLLSVQPRHMTERAYEQLSAICNVVPVMASGMASVRPATTCRVAFGPCLVTSRSAFDVVGGFESVRGDVVEDLALAARYASHRRTVRCLSGGETVRFRMYPGGARSLAQGWVKNLSGGARRAAPWPTAGAVAWVAGSLAVAVGLVTQPSWPLAALYVAFALQLAWMLRRLGAFRWWTSALYPLAVIAFAGFFVASVTARGVRRSVTWSGRRIRVAGR
jgi:hypothetical protein